MRNVQIFSTDTDDGVVSVVAKTGPGEHRQVKQIRVGNAPRGGVKFTKGGRGFVCNTSQNTLSEIDAVALTEVRRIEVGHGPRGLGILPGDRYVLVSNSGSDSLSIVDLELNVELRQIPLGRDPRHMMISSDGAWAYVCVWGDGYVSKLDVSGLKNGDAAAVHEVAQIPVDREAHPYSLNIDPSGRRVFVANTQATYVTVIDVATNETHRVDVGYIGGRGVAFSEDGKYAFITVETVARIYVVDVETLEVTRHIPVGPGPRGLVVDHNDFTAYISNFARASVISLPEEDKNPAFGPNTLTMVDLKSAPLDRQEGEFEYEEIFVGYGPCSVVMFDLDTIPEEERLNRVDRVEA
ncbi:YncE family protein [Streptomyces sp. NBC_00988]|uniref:YncE family protein n=1 Tax=Streptomyces sp. NBC_00988 TaxID=2903704 RepID=UPI003866EE31|nr:YncE family protein [Streptomyces sp. NBC_00988]